MTTSKGIPLVVSRPLSAAGDHAPVAAPTSPLVAFATARPAIRPSGPHAQARLPRATVRAVSASSWARAQARRGDRGAAAVREIGPLSLKGPRLPYPTPASARAGGGRATFAGTLEDVQSAGVLKCGINTGLVGFASTDDDGNWVGFDVAYCRALAAARSLSLPLQVAPRGRLVAALLVARLVGLYVDQRVPATQPPVPLPCGYRAPAGVARGPSAPASARRGPWSTSQPNESAMNQARSSSCRWP